LWRSLFWHGWHFVAKETFTGAILHWYKPVGGVCERRGKDKEKMRAQKPAAIPEPQWGCGYLTNHGLEIFVVKSLDCPPVVKWDFRSQHKSKAMSREKKFGGRKNQQLEATCCIFYRMLASVSSSWQHIYYRYLTFAFFLFNLSSHTVTFL